MKKIILTILFSFSVFHVIAQIDRCATDKMVYEELQLNPDKKLVLDQLELFTNTFIDNFENGRVVDTTYIVPVVVHVIHNYGEERISTNQIESAIQSMCDDFSMSNDDFINPNGEFVHSTVNNNDTVSIMIPDDINNSVLVNWLVEEGSSVQKNDTICSLNNDNNIHFLIADDPGNLRFCGGIINHMTFSEEEVNPGDIIAKIITTEGRGFEDLAANIGVEFRLATKDPDGNCSNGVTYNQSTLTYIGGENVKDDTYWDNSKYLNIWTVANVASGAAAYAYYPGSAPTNHEGILCQHDYFGTTGTSSNGNWRRHTMAHEAGHYFNLAHPWGSTNDSALEENCGSDDGVDDTPNTVGASGCLSFESQISCESLDNVANIMDYTNCAYMFTKGQKSRVIAALNATAGYRNNLWTQSNLEATGTDDNHYFDDPYSDCKPIADFRVIGDAIGALGTNGGFNVSFEDMSYNVPQTDISYEWFFPGAEPSTSNLQNPTATYNVSGQHDVSLIVSNSSGSSELIKQKCIIVLDQVSAPFVEDFESLEFPINASIDEPSWYILDNYPTETNWEKTTAGSYEGDQSIRIRSQNFHSSIRSVKQAIYTPEINCSEFTPSNNPQETLRAYFNVAYAKRLPYQNEDGNSIIPDKLIISRKHANQDWMVRGTFLADSLSNTDRVYFNEYIPENNHWKSLSVNIANSAGQESVILRFEFSGKGHLSADTVIMTNNGGEYISDNVGGNWLYIDNFKIGTLNTLDTMSRVNTPTIMNDDRIFDLFGREYFNRLSLKQGVYVQNKKLFFIRED
tara:strand:+ start:6225 stop:8612 length:2388 start_codon:yes stop_codon:yes gene_type:complete